MHIASTARRRPPRVPTTPTRRRGKALLVAALTIPLFAAACSGGVGGEDEAGSASAPAKAITDQTGAEINVPGKVDNVVCLTAICDDALTELGMVPVASTNAGEQGILADPSFLGEGAAKEVAKIDGSFGEENLEQVIAEEPDLVIGLEGVHDGLRASLQDAAPLYLASPASFEDSKKFLRQMGELTGREKQAEEAEARFDEVLAKATEDTEGKGARTLAMFGTDRDFGVDTKDSVVGSVLGKLGDYPWEIQTNSSGHTGKSQGTYSLEEIARKNPNVIFVQTFSFGPTASKKVSEQLADDPIWSQLDAVKNNRVVEVPTKIWAEGRGTRSLGLVAKQAAEVIAKK